MEVREALAQLGLSKDETTVYLTALELGETLLLPLAKKSGLSRSVIYPLLPHLHQLGLIAYGAKGKRQTLIAQDPVSLLNLQEARIKELRTTLPQLLSTLNYQRSSAKVRSYEGVEGIKLVYEDTLAEEFPISSFLEVSQINPEVQEYLLKSYVPRRVKRGIRVKNLVSGTLESDQEILPEQGSYRDNKYVEPKEYPAPMELLIYGNKVAFIKYRKDQQAKAVVIEDGEVAQTLRSLHKMGWVALS